MKKTAYNLILIAFALVCVLLNVILFLTVDDARVQSGVFWLAWAFTFPLNLLAAFGVRLWTGRGEGALVRVPVASYISYAFFGVYLVLGLIFMYAPIVSVTVPLILELVVTVAYAVIAMYAVYAAEYIVKNQKHTKEKVLYIRMLKADVDDCVALAADPALRATLSEFSERVRFSDPMSHASLAGVEAELDTIVSQIRGAIDAGDNALAAELVTKGMNTLERRNSRCLMLK